MWGCEKQVFKLCLYRAAAARDAAAARHRDRGHAWRGRFPSLRDRIKNPATANDTEQFGNDTLGRNCLPLYAIQEALVADTNVVQRWLRSHPSDMRSLHLLYKALEEGGELWEAKAPRDRRTLDQRLEDRAKRKRRREEAGGTSAPAAAAGVSAATRRTIALFDEVFDGRPAGDEVDEFDRMSDRLDELSTAELRALLVAEEQRQKDATDRIRIIHGIIRVKGILDIEERLDVDMICPITQCTMSDPVFAADGFTYERDAIQRWFATGHRRSPKTNLDLRNTGLTPNYALRAVIDSITARRAAAPQEPAPPVYAPTSPGYSP